MFIYITDILFYSLLLFFGQHIVMPSFFDLSSLTEQQLRTKPSANSEELMFSAVI